MGKELKKIDLSQTVSILANIGVIAGIAFLGFELNQNNALLESQARYNLVVQRAAINDAVREPSVLSAIQKQAAGEELDLAQTMTLLSVAARVIESWEWQYNEYQAGLLELRQLPVANWSRLYRGRLVPLQDVWNTRSSEMDAEFVQFMTDNVINRQGE